MKPIAPLNYDYSGLIAPRSSSPFVSQTGLSEHDLAWLAPRLDAARNEVLANVRLFHEGGIVSEDMLPLSLIHI